MAKRPSASRSLCGAIAIWDATAGFILVQSDVWCKGVSAGVRLKGFLGPVGG